MFVHAREVRLIPANGFGGTVDPEKNRLSCKCIGQFAELDARELHKRDWSGLGADALQDGEASHQRGLWRGVEIEFQPYGNRVAFGGGGEIGRKEKAEHAGEPVTRAGAIRHCWIN